MAEGFELDLSEVFKGIDFISERIADAAERGMEMAMAELHNEADALAPELSGNLRKKSRHIVTRSGYSITGEVVYSAISQSKRGWSYNYALRLHEWPRRFVNPSKPGTGPKFLSRPLKAKQGRLQEIIAEEIRKEMV